MLGMPESTFRRHLHKAKAIMEEGASVRIREWLFVQEVLPALLNPTGARAKEDVVTRARRMLLEEVVTQVSGNDKLGAALMGITLPTYRNRKAELKSDQGLMLYPGDNCGCSESGRDQPQGAPRREWP